MKNTNFLREGRRVKMGAQHETITANDSLSMAASETCRHSDGVFTTRENSKRIGERMGHNDVEEAQTDRLPTVAIRKQLSLRP